MKQQVIGTTELLIVPEVSEQPIPTKVDTGADGSSIWASEVIEKDGVLSFVFFGPQSSFYSGKSIETNDYSIVRVKNSFGEKEFRYRIKLSIKIAGKSYKTSFTLADRSRNRYPILLGKRFLKSRFLVDVAKRNVISETEVASDETKVVVLTSRTDGATKAYFKKVAKRAQLPIELVKYRLMGYEISEDGVPKISLPDGSDIAGSSLVYFKAHKLYAEHAGAIAKYLQYRHVAFFDAEIGGFVSRSKLSELFILAMAGIPLPSVKVFASGIAVSDYDKALDFFGESTFIVKDAFSDRGRNNFIVQSREDFADAVERLKDVKTVIAQKYIPNNGFLRVLIMGGETVQVVERSASEHDDPLKMHLNKPHGSGNATGHDPTKYDVDVLVLAHKAALAMDRNVAGIDLIQHEETKKWYVLEVNANPELTSGYGQEDKIRGMVHLLTGRK